MLGGAATILGPSLGAVLFWVVFAFLGSLLPAMAKAGVLPITDAQADVVRYIVIGVVLMLIVVFRPQGILGNKREMTFVK